MTVSIVFETHSTTLDNERGIATGWLPGRLSELGRAQAAEMGARRREDGLAAVVVSDLARAIETVEIAFGDSNVPVRVDGRLREVDYGDWNGQPVERIDAERVRRVALPFPGGESYRDAAGRMATFLGDLAPEFAGRRVLLVGHAATRWSLDHLLAGAPLESLVAAPFDWRPGWEYELADVGRLGSRLGGGR